MVPRSRSPEDNAWLALIGLLSLAYIDYALRGAFFFDDFFLYQRYAGDHGQWWEYHKHFGRIITRYFYWTWLPRLFGSHPEAYLLFNFAFILFGAWAFGRLLVAMAESGRVLLPAVALYLLAPTTFHGFTWIAAFQHIGAYPFLFLFLWQMVELARSWRPRTALVATASFALAILSNQFAVMAPAMALILTVPWLRRNPRCLALVLLLGGVSLAVVMVLIGVDQRGAYAHEYSWSMVARNLAWYGDRMGFGSSLPKYLAIIGVVLVLATRSWRSALFAAVAVLGALPFVFLALRRNTYFMHLPYVFVLAALLAAVIRFDRPLPRSVPLVLLTLLVGYSSFDEHRDTYLEPLGADLKKEAAMIRAALPGEGNTVCVAWDSDDAGLRRRHHMRTVALVAYQVLDRNNVYVRYDDVERCAATDFRLWITFDRSGNLGHRLEDARTGESILPDT